MSATPVSMIVYYARYAFVVLIMGYHLMELDMIKISFPGFLERYGVVQKDNKKEVMSRFSELYSWQLVFGIPSTLLWGFISDKYGSFKTSVVHLAIHIVVCSYLAFTTDYQGLFYGHIVLSFFSNYVISVQTFTSWIPQDQKMSFNATSQMITSGMLQIAPFVAGIVINYSDATSLVRIYHAFLATLLFTLLLGYILSFKDFKEEIAKPAQKQSKTDGKEGFFAGIIPAVTNGVKEYLVVFTDKGACSVIMLGIYLRLAKKLVDVALHLWADIGVNENGLGFDKMALSQYSTAGGLLSVVLYKYLSNEDLQLIPENLRSSLLTSAVVFLLMPFLSLPSGILQNICLVSIILVFNYCFSALFAVWIGLINNGIKKEMKSKNFALTLAIRSIIGSWISDQCFNLFKWALGSPQVTNILGGKLNSAIFFWLFALINGGMFLFFRRLKLVKLEKEYTIAF